MRLEELSCAELRQQLKGPGVFWRIGPFTVHLRGNLSELSVLLQRLYADYDLEDYRDFADFHIYLQGPRGIRRWWKPQAELYIDNNNPFSPFEVDNFLPYLEWGLNWCVVNRANHMLMLHAGVLEKEGQAVLLPALPGSGKSTLCAALMHRGWRLLTDEIALVRLADLAIVPLPRPIPLKNNSISIIRAFAPDAVFGPEYHNTRKGTVAHLRPSSSSIQRAGEVARVAKILFPQFQSQASLRLQPLPKASAFVKLSLNSFNYDLLGLQGFEALCGLVDNCDSYLFQYGDLETAVAQLDALRAGQVF